MEEKHAIDITDLVISYQNLKKTSIKKSLLHFRHRTAERFVAVKGISFYVRQGEILGIIGKKPEIKYQVSPGSIAELAALQREILSVARRYVKPGGRLVYSTCTISRQENEDQRAWFLEQFAEFEPESLAGRLSPAVEAESLREGYIQLLPGRDPCDGFFIAAFRKQISEKHEI